MIPGRTTYLGYASSQSNSLAPGQSYTTTASFTIPQGLSGPYYVFIDTDFYHSVNDTSFDNNVAFNPIQIKLLPPVDLVAGIVTIPANASPGDR